MATIGSLGTDPNYSSLLEGNRNPRMLMAQKLMELQTQPTNNSTQSSFWANLLNQGLRGGLGGWMYKDAIDDEAKQAEAQRKEAEEFAAERPTMGGGGQSAAPPAAPAPVPMGGSPAPSPAQPDGSSGRARSAGGGGAAPKPELTTVASPSGVKFTVAKDAADAYTGFLSELEGSGYKLDQSQSGGYNPRKIAGTDTWSQHAHGHAVDVNWQRNPRGADGPTDLPQNVGDIAAKYGLTWGGNWSGKTRDPMHFEYGRRSADATPQGNPIDALMAGVNAPKPRGIQLAENLVPGTGRLAQSAVATDSPTPILPNMDPGSIANRSGANPEATLPNMAPVSTASTPLPVVTPPPTTPPATPKPPYQLWPTPPGGSGETGGQPASLPPAPDPEPPMVAPQGSGETGGQPTPAVLPPPNPPEAPIVAPAGSGETGGQPTPAALPELPMVAPAGSGETGGQPAVSAQRLVGQVPQAPEPPIPIPPIPPRQGGGQPIPGGNTTEALNTASLAAARAGQNYVPPGAGGGPTGPQLAAPLLPNGSLGWAGGLTPQGQPLLTPAGAPSGPTGPQLAAPLMPPGAAPAGPTTPGAATPVSDTSGGQPKGPAPAQGQQPQHPGLPSQDYVDQLSVYAQRAAASSNPRIRAQAGPLAAEAQHMQRRIDTFTQQDQRRQDQQTARDEGDRNRRAAFETALAARNPMIEKATDPVTGVETYRERDPVSGKWHDTGMVSKPGGQSLDVDKPVSFAKDPLGTAYTTLQATAAQEAKGPLSPTAIANRETAGKIILQHQQTVATNTGVSVTQPPMPDYSKAYPQAGGEPAAAPAQPPPGTQTGPNTSHFANPDQRQPEPVIKQMLTTTENLRGVSAAIRDLQNSPNAIGPMIGKLPDTILNIVNPDGTKARASLGDIGSMKMLSRTGQAASVQEMERVKPFIPSKEDTYEAAQTKMLRFQKAYANELQDWYETYGKGNNYQRMPQVEKEIQNLRNPELPRGTAEQIGRMVDVGQSYTLPNGKIGVWNGKTFVEQ